MPFAVFALVARYGSRDEVIGTRAIRISENTYETQALAERIAARDDDCDGDVWIVCRDTRHPFRRLALGHLPDHGLQHGLQQLRADGETGAQRHRGLFPVAKARV